MNKNKITCLIIYIILMMVFLFIMGTTLSNLSFGELFLKLDEYNENTNGYKYINCYSNINLNSPERYITYKYCALDGITSKLIDKEVLIVSSTDASASNIYFYINYITDNFKTENMKELYIDSDIEIHSDNFEKNNPKLEKIYFNDKSFLNGRVLSTISHKKLYYVDKNCMDLFGKEFNLMKQDFECLYPNIIYMVNNNKIWNGIDIDDNKLPSDIYISWSNSNSIKSYDYDWYLDENYIIPFDTNTIIKKEYQIDENGDLIYIYRPVVLYGKRK